MVELTYSVFELGQLRHPICEVLDYPELSDYFSTALPRTKCGILRTINACRRISDGSIEEFDAPGSESHVVKISRSLVLIDRYFHPDAADPDAPVHFEIPFDVFFDALSQWAVYVRRFERSQVRNDRG